MHHLGFFAHIVFFVLIAGVASLTGIFTSLLWGDFFEIFAAAFALIYGGYIIMRMVSCFARGLSSCMMRQ